MSNRVLHAIDIKKIGIISLLGAALGAILLFVPITTLIDLVITFIGLVLIIVNGIQVYNRVSQHEESSNEMLLDVLGVLSGFVLLVSSGVVITIIIAIYLFVESALKLYKVKFDKEAIIDEMPRIILGIVLLLCCIGEFAIFFKLVGVGLIILSLGYLGYNYYLYKQSKVKIIK